MGIKDRKMLRRTRRRSLAAAGLVLALVASWASAAEKTPRLVVDREEIDLGTLPYSTPARAVFTLRNTGDAVLKVVDVPPVKALKGC